MQAFEEKEYDKKFDAGVWRRLLRYARPYYPHLAGVLALMLVCAATDVLFPLLSREAIDVYITGGTTQGLGGFVAKYLAVVLVQFSCVIGFCFLAGRVEVGMCHRIRRMGFQRLQELPFSYYDRTPIGYLIARMTSDTQRLGDTIGWSLIDLAWGAGYILFTIVAMVSLDVKMSLAVIAIMPIIAVVTVFFQKRIFASYRQVRRLNSQITGAFNEGITGAKTTKTLGREDENFANFQLLTGRMRSSSVRSAVLSAIFMPLVVSLGAVAAAYVLWKGGYDVFSGAMTFGTLTAFVNYSLQIFEPINNLARIFADLQSSQSAAERVMQLLETQPDIADSAPVERIFGDNFHPRKENWPPMAGRVQFEDVSFHYQQGEEVLSHFNLTVEPGETVALVGETGSGKSTIVNLLCRFYQPDSGRILIDGVDYRERSQLWLEHHLGYVLQQPHLFSGTVRENIRYGCLEASDLEVEQAAKLVAADEFIRLLPQGYDTQVGEGGGRLSTGQKQLISFARALLRGPKLFVLDEATSSVDTQTEQKIQRAIQLALKGRTSFIIAHRLSTVRGADRILVIEDGALTEQGTHKELMAHKGYYYDLYVNQFRRERQRQVLGARGRRSTPTSNR